MTVHMIWIDEDQHPSFPDWESAWVHFAEHSWSVSHAFEHTGTGVTLYTHDELDGMYEAHLDDMRADKRQDDSCAVSGTQL